MFDSIIIDGREQKLKVDKIEAPDGKKLSLGAQNRYPCEDRVGYNRLWDITFVIHDNKQHIVKIPTNVIETGKKYVGSICLPINETGDLSEYLVPIMAEGSDRIAGLLQTIYQGNLLGTVAESRVGGLEMAMGSLGFDVIVPSNYYKPPVKQQDKEIDYVLLARDMPAVNDLRLQQSIAEMHVKSLYRGRPGIISTLELIHSYFDPKIELRNKPGAVQTIDTTLIPSLLTLDSNR